MNLGHPELLYRYDQSSLKKSLKNVSLKEITSISAMRSGRKDILVQIRQEIEDVDVESIQNSIIHELESLALQVN
jgi:hypothetical protein